MYSKGITLPVLTDPVTLNLKSIRKIENEMTEKKVTNETETNNALPATQNSTAIATRASAAIATADNRELAMDFQRALKAVSDGFDDFDKPSELVEQLKGVPLNLIGAYTVKDFVDKKSGEVSDKFVYKFVDMAGITYRIMQSDTGVRKQITNLFEQGEALGLSVEVRGVQLKSKNTGQIQAAVIFDMSNAQPYINGAPARA